MDVRMALWVLALQAIFFFFFISGSSSEPIRKLPGLPKKVPFKQHSGYIVTDHVHGRALFYYFVEANVADPLSRPLTFWLNGGPGCSSLGFGVFMEHGPFQPGSDGSLVPNKYSWNLESNMLYVETPIGVGFSYSNTTSDYRGWNDSTTANDNLQFLINWFEEFPRYKNSDLYLTGESYAGHYIPQFAALLQEHNKQPHVKPINFKAILLGNPLLDFDISISAGEYLWSHGAISDETLMLEKTVCNFSMHWRHISRNTSSKECTLVFDKLQNEVGRDVDNSDLLLPQCLPSNGQMHTKIAQQTNGVDPCLPNRIPVYLNRPDVQKALHANTTHLSFPWDFCTTTGPLAYRMEDMEINIIPVVTEILKSGIPIMLYSGDQDSKIPLTQTRIIANNLVKELNLQPLTSYAPWYDNKQVGGWAQSFGSMKEGKNITYLTFTTIRGAGHEVPFTAPSQAFTMFRAFLNGFNLPSS